MQTKRIHKVEKAVMTIPTPCKTCKHRYNDIEEGHNCTKYDAKITLSSGAVLEWPGQAVEKAFEVCSGSGYERSTLGPLKWLLRI